MFTDDGILKNIAGHTMSIKEAIDFYDKNDLLFASIDFVLEENGQEQKHRWPCIKHSMMTSDGIMMKTFRSDIERISKYENFLYFVRHDADYGYK